MLQGLKKTLSIIHQLFDEVPQVQGFKRYLFYSTLILNSLATFLNFGLIFSIFYFYLENKTNLQLSLLALALAVSFKLLTAYLKITYQVTINKELNSLITLTVFSHTFNKKNDHYANSTFKVEQLSKRINTFLSNYLSLISNLCLFLLTSVILLFKTTLIFTILLYFLFAIPLIWKINQNRGKLERLSYKTRRKRFFFTNDIIQLKDRLTGIDSAKHIPSRFSELNQKHFAYRTLLQKNSLFQRSIIEIYTLCFLTLCFLCWNLLYDKQEVLVLLSLLALITVQLFPKALNSISSYQAMQNNHSFLKEFFILKEEKNFPNYQGEGGLLLNEQNFTIKDLTLSYGKQVLLKKTSLTLPSKGHFLINSPNGTGKSTLFKWILENMVRKNKTKVYYLPQEIYLFKGTILENINLFEEDYDLKQVQRALIESGFQQVMEEKKYSLHSIINNEQLSGGEKTKLTLASMIYHQDNFSLLLIDESSVNLDQASKRRFYQTLKQKMKDKLILEISHEKEFCKELPLITITKELQLEQLHKKTDSTLRVPE